MENSNPLGHFYAAQATFLSICIIDYDSPERLGGAGLKCWFRVKNGIVQGRGEGLALGRLEIDSPHMAKHPNPDVASFVNRQTVLIFMSQAAGMLSKRTTVEMCWSRVKRFPETVAIAHGFFVFFNVSV